MQKLVMIGAGGMCKEVISLISDINKQRERFEICGILDDAPRLAGQWRYGFPILGPIEQENLPAGSKAVLCVATHRNILLRATIGNRLNLDSERWASIVHPQASVAYDAELNPGVILYPGSRVADGAKVGMNSFLYFNSVLHHDSSIGAYTQVCAGVLIAGRVAVGDRCYLGIGSILRDNIVTADETLIGMGAVVTKDVLQQGQVFIGNPARLRTLKGE